MSTRAARLTHPHTTPPNNKQNSTVAGVGVTPHQTFIWSAVFAVLLSVTMPDSHLLEQHTSPQLSAFIALSTALRPGIFIVASTWSDSRSEASGASWLTAVGVAQRTISPGPAPLVKKLYRVDKQGGRRRLGGHVRAPARRCLAFYTDLYGY